MLLTGQNIEQNYEACFRLSITFINGLEVKLVTNTLNMLRLMKMAKQLKICQAYICI